MNWPWRVPEQLEDPFPKVPPTEGRYVPIRGTVPFWLVYSQVTEMIREFAQLRADDIKQFLEFLVAGFYYEYKRWDVVAPDYFRKFQRPRPLRLMALAYFHMGYDLPRTIAKALSASPSLGVDRNDARQVFLQLNPRFRPILQTQFRSYKSSGIMGAFAKVLPLNAATRVASYWLVQMRVVAWVHGEIIASAKTATERRRFQYRLLTAVVDCGNRVAKAWWNPVFWFAWWPAPTVAVFVPLIGLTFPHLNERILLELSGAVGAIWTTYLGMAYRGFVKVTEKLGQEITAALLNLVPPEYQERLEDLRHEVDLMRWQEESEEA